MLLEVKKEMKAVRKIHGGSGRMRPRNAQKS